MKTLYLTGTVVFLVGIMIVGSQIYGRYDSPPLTQVSIPQAEIVLDSVACRGLAEGTFHLVNVGSAPLRLQGVQTDCGCTVAAWSQTPVAAGDTAVVRVRYDKTDQPGYFRQVIQVDANVAGQTEVVVLRGRVWCQ